MLPLIRSFASPLVSLLFMMMGSGLMNTFVSLRLEMEGYPSESIGAVASALYLGIFLGSFKIDQWIGKVGHIHSFVFFAAFLSAIVLLQSFWINPWYWSLLRVAGGICTAGIFIIIESWLLIQSPPDMRGGILSIYLAVLYGALSSGQLLIGLTDPRGLFPFSITALFAICSIFPLLIRKIPEPKIEQGGARLSLIQLYRISPLGFLGGIISGMVLAATYGLVPVYAAEIGMGLSEIGQFMAILIFGGFSLQWPIGRWADRGDRRFVLKMISLITAFLCIAIPFVKTGWILLIFAWLFGGFAFTLYPISMAYACERVKEKEIVAATGGFVLSYGLGAIGGPLIAPIGMDRFGPQGLFYFFSFLALLLALAAFKRPAPAIIDKGDL